MTGFYGFKAKNVLDLMVVPENLNFCSLHRQTADLYLTLFKRLNLNKDEIKLFLSQPRDVYPPRKNDKFGDVNSDPLIFDLFVDGEFKGILKGLEGVLDDKDVMDLFDVRNRRGQRLVRCYSIMGKKEIISIGSESLNYNISCREKIIELLFVSDKDNKSVLQEAARFDFAYLGKFIVDARLESSSILKIMSRLVVDPVSEEQALKKEHFEMTRDYPLIMGFSYFAYGLLQNDHLDAAKSMAFCEECIRRLPKVDPSWLKIFRIMKRVYQKQGGSSSTHTLSKPAEIQEKGPTGEKRLEVYAIK
jgi:hypothetical protein